MPVNGARVAGAGYNLLKSGRPDRVAGLAKVRRWHRPPPQTARSAQARKRSIDDTSPCDCCDYVIAVEWQSQIAISSIKAPRTRENDARIRQIPTRLLSVNAGPVPRHAFRPAFTPDNVRHLKRTIRQSLAKQSDNQQLKLSFFKSAQIKPLQDHLPRSGQSFPCVARDLDSILHTPRRRASRSRYMSSVEHLVTDGTP